jgi:hypothetical protein
MTHLLVLGGLLFGFGPFKINGINVTAKELQHVGQVSYRAALASFNGGRVALRPARQHALDAILSRSGTVVLALVDNSSTDTTAFTFGQMKLVRKSDKWYLVNTTDLQWRQLELGPATAGEALNLALVEDGAQAHVYFNGRDFGTTPYDSHSPQTMMVGSPPGEANPWQGGLKAFEVLPRQLSAVNLEDRFAALSPGGQVASNTDPGAPAPGTTNATPAAPPVSVSSTPVTSTTVRNPPARVVEVPSTPVPSTTVTGSPPPSSPSNSNPPTTTPAPTTTTPSAVATKSTVVVADVTAITTVPEPSSILPYRHAIVTEEYKVVEVKSGHIDKVDIGKLIRVARWGVVNGQKTDVSGTRVGDRILLTLELYSDHPDLEHYYTVDTLPDNFSLPYLLDTGRKTPGGG